MMSDAAKVGLGLGAAAVAVVIGWVASSKSSSSSSSTPTNPTGPGTGGTTYTMVAGHRYTIDVIATSAFSPPASGAQAALDQAAGAGVYKIVGGVQMPSANEAQMAVDVTTNRKDTGAMFIAAVGAPAGATISVADDGPSSGSGVAWVAATTINPGDHVRGSISETDFTTIQAALGITQTGIQGWATLLSLPQIANVLSSASVSAWAPGDPLPTDWPPGDTGAATEYHVDFVYGGTAPLLVSTLPVPLQVWVAKGIGSGNTGATTGGSLPGGVIGVHQGAGGVPTTTWEQTQTHTQIPTGTRIRMSIPPGGLQAYGFALQLNTNDLATVLQALLSDSRWVAASANSQLTVYQPGTQLPSDWPSDEPSAVNNWHVDVVVGGPGFMAGQLSTAAPGTVIWTPTLVFSP